MSEQDESHLIEATVLDERAARYEQALDRIIAGSKPRGLHGKTRLTRDMMQMVAYEARYPRP